MKVNIVQSISCLVSNWREFNVDHWRWCLFCYLTILDQVTSFFKYTRYVSGWNTHIPYNMIYINKTPLHTWFIVLIINMIKRCICAFHWYGMNQQCYLLHKSNSGDTQVINSMRLCLSDGLGLLISENSYGCLFAIKMLRNGFLFEADLFSPTFSHRVQHFEPSM